MSGVGDTKRRLVTAKRLFRLWVAVSVLGVVLPITTIVLKLAANDFEHWKRLKRSGPAPVAELLSVPAFDLSERAPFLSRLAWHHGGDVRWLPFYARYACLNVGVLGVLALGRRRIGAALTRAVDWLHRPDHPYPRRVVFTAAVTIVATYQMKVPLGFWFPGISGWTYAGRRAVIDTASPPPPISADTNAESDADAPAFIRTALIEANARRLPRPGYVTGSAMFLHFAGGQVLPSNYEITGLVFPQYVVGPLYDRPRDGPTLVRLVRHGLEQPRRGRSFLLPTAIAYPPHSRYMPVNYRAYPPADELVGISTWRLRVYVDADRRVRVVRAWQEGYVDAR